jgi:hypothetical protein
MALRCCSRSRATARSQPSSSPARKRDKPWEPVTVGYETPPGSSEGAARSTFAQLAWHRPAERRGLAGIQSWRSRPELEFRNLKERVSGPWPFRDMPSRTGPLNVRVNAAGRELRLYDLIVRTSDVSIGYRELSPGGTNSPPPGALLPLRDLFLDTPHDELTDDRGTDYRLAAVYVAGVGTWKGTLTWQ